MVHTHPPQKTDPSACSLHRSPPELLYEIMRNAGAKDIVSLCSTCRAFRSLLSEQTVWILILRFVCHEDGIYFPSYEISSMSINELQRAATGQYRLTQLLRQNCVSDETQNSLDGLPTLRSAFEATRLDIPAMVSPESEDISRREGNFVLIPGGRYLVKHDLPFVKLFDLGPACQLPLSTPIQIASIASTEREPFWFGAYLLAWEHDSGGLRVAVGIGARNEPSFSVSVYTVLPTAPAPKFEILGSVVFTSPHRPDWAMQVHQSRIYVSSHEGGIVWDFETRRYIPIPTYHGERLEDEVFVGDYVVNFGWELLAVSPVGSEEIDTPPSGQIMLPPAITGPRPYEFQYPFQHQNETHVTRPPPIRPHMAFPLIFYGASAPGSDKPFHATVDLIKSLGRPHLFRIFFSAKKTYSWPSRLDGFMHILDPSTSTRGRSFSRILVRVSDRGLQFDGHVGVMLFPNGETDAKDTLTILQLDSMDSGDFITLGTLCPASGRLLYTVWGKTGVFVVDYLLP